MITPKQLEWALSRLDRAILRRASGFGLSKMGDVVAGYDFKRNKIWVNEDADFTNEALWRVLLHEFGHQIWYSSGAKEECEGYDYSEFVGMTGLLAWEHLAEYREEDRMSEVFAEFHAAFAVKLFYHDRGEDDVNVHGFNEKKFKNAAGLFGRYVRDAYFGEPITAEGLVR